MKIVFWQPYYMEYGSEYLAKSMAGVSSLMGKSSVLVESPVWEEKTKEDLSNKLVAEASFDYYPNPKDLGRIIDIYKEDGRCPRQFVRDNAIMAGKNCFRIPYHVEESSRAAYEALTYYGKEIFSLLSKEYQYVFWDVGRLQGNCLAYFFENADLIVVNVENNQEMLDSFFETVHRFQQKYFYLISGGDFHGHLSKDAIINRYRIEEPCFDILKHYHNFFACTGEKEIMWRIRQEYEHRKPYNFGEECMQAWRKMLKFMHSSK